MNETTKNRNYGISCGDLDITIAAYGAELRSVRYQGCEYLWQADPAYWDGQSPLLFPYVGRFTDGKYTLRGKEYALPIHGFAKDSVFEAVPLGKSSIRFELRDSEETVRVYPCPFRLAVTYEARENALSVTYEVTNPGDEILYFGIGGHPAINVPLEDGRNFEEYYLEFGAPAKPDRVGHTDACFQSGIDAPYPLEGGTRLPLHHDLFDRDAIVLRNAADTVTLKCDGSSRSVTMRYPGLPYLGLWHMPKTDAPYVCIEPWSSLPSRQDIVEEFTCKSDLIRLPAGQTYRTGWEMSLT